MDEITKKQISSVSDELRALLERKSARALPDRPSEAGMKPDEIKRAFWAPLLDAEGSLLAETERVIKEANELLGTVHETERDHGKRIGTLETFKEETETHLSELDKTDENYEKRLSDIESGINIRIVDDLDTADPRLPLSANMGKELKLRVDNSVPRMHVLDAVATKDWYKMDDYYNRVYTELSYGRGVHPYYVLSMTADKEAVPSPSGSIFNWAKGEYFDNATAEENYTTEELRNATRWYEGDNGVSVQITTKDVDDVERECVSVKKLTDGAYARYRIKPKNDSVAGGKKTVVEFDALFEGEPKYFSTSDKWFAEFNLIYDLKRTNYDSVENRIILWTNDEGNISLHPNGETHIKMGEWVNFKIAQYGGRIEVYVNDIPIIRTEARVTEFSTFNGVDLNIRTYAYGVDMFLANAFINVVDEDYVHAGRKLDTVTQRVANGHVLVPDRLTKYKDYEIYSADRYAVSYGVMKEYVADKVQKLYRHQGHITGFIQGWEYWVEVDFVILSHLASPFKNIEDIANMIKEVPLIIHNCKLFTYEGVPLTDNRDNLLFCKGKMINDDLGEEIVALVGDWFEIEVIVTGSPNSKYDFLSNISDYGIAYDSVIEV